MRALTGQKPIAYCTSKYTVSDIQHYVRTRGLTTVVSVESSSIMAKFNFHHHSWQNSILMHKQQTWQKKGDTTFDVTMGSYDGAETCELVGSFLLSQLQNHDLNIGLYRDDGLAISNATPRQTEYIKKEICRIFNLNGLRITIEANKQIVNFLDVTFNLSNGTYQPFTKPNSTLRYVHRESNHPSITTKNIPAVINKRLSSLSSDKAPFEQAAPRLPVFSYQHLFVPPIFVPPRNMFVPHRIHVRTT